MTWLGYNISGLAWSSHRFKGKDMSRSNSSTSPEEILQKLLEQARANWGEERAQEILATLESTSRQLSEVSTHLPDKETEPGFYQ
jgi:hypothetical protein